MYEPPPHSQRVLVKHFRELDDQKQKAPRKHWSQNIIDFENNTFLARTPLSWLKIIVFYLIFYSILVGYWMSVFMIFERSLNHTIPAIKIKSPGLSFAPALDPYHTEQTIRYSLNNQMDIRRYARSVDDFLGKYVQNTSKYFHNCNEDGKWGYLEGSPCVFIKFNRILGWSLNKEKVSPETLPFDIVYYIKTLPNVERINKVWIRCLFNNSEEVLVQYFDYPYVLGAYLEFDEKKYYAEKDRDPFNTISTNQYFFSHTDIRRVIAVKLMHLKRNVWFYGTCNAYAANAKFHKPKHMDHMISFRIQINDT